MGVEKADTRIFISILTSDGTFRLPVEEGTEGAVKREYETSDGNKGVKHELVLKAVSGRVEKVSFAETNFGKLIQLSVDTGEEGEGTLTISTNTSNSFGIDLMKKLPNLDFSKVYRFAPFSFEGDNGKPVRGISITEGEEYTKDEKKKVKNFFFDEDKKKELHDFPTPSGDTSKYTKNKWKAYFGEVEDFLIAYTEEKVITKLGASEDDDMEKDAIENF